MTGLMLKGLGMEPKSDATASEAKAYSEYARRQEGDFLDRIGLREGMDDRVMAVMLALGVGLWVGEAMFAYDAGKALFPGMPKPGGVSVGGVLTIINSALFVFSAFMHGRDGRKRLKSPWFIPMIASLGFAFTAIYVSQTNAADKVRVVVEERERLEKDIRQAEADLRVAVLPSRTAMEIQLNTALDEAVGWELGDTREDVNCTQDIPDLARGVCRRIGVYRAQLAQLDTDEERLERLRQSIIDNQATLDGMETPTNAFIKAIAEVTGWELQRAQSWTYMFLSLMFLIIPAIVFRQTLELSTEEPSLSPSPPQSPDPR